MKALRIIMVSNILLFCAGCDKQNEVAFPASGNIVGFIKLIDNIGYDAEDKSGVNVSIEGLAIATQTDKTGRFELTNVPAGTYNIIYEKTAYGTRRIFSYQFIGGNLPAMVYETALYKQPDIELQSLDISFEGNQIEILGEISETDRYIVQSFINDSSNVSNLNYDYSSTTQNFCCAPVKRFFQSIHLDEGAYTPGDKIYLVVYFMNPNEQGHYDYEKEMQVYTSYKKASNVITLTLD